MSIKKETVNLFVRLPASPIRETQETLMLVVPSTLNERNSNDIAGNHVD